MDIISKSELVKKSSNYKSYDEVCGELNKLLSEAASKNLHHIMYRLPFNAEEYSLKLFTTLREKGYQLTYDLRESSSLGDLLTLEW